jgi:hypothetical protein
MNFSRNTRRGCTLVVSKIQEKIYCSMCVLLRIRNNSERTDEYLSVIFAHKRESSQAVFIPVFCHGD